MLPWPQWPTVKYSRTSRIRTKMWKITFLAPGVIFPGNTIIPRWIELSSRMLSNLRETQQEHEKRPIGDTKIAPFFMVFTPTVLSSEKNTKIWSDGLWRELVKKLSWFRLTNAISWNWNIPSIIINAYSTLPAWFAYIDLKVGRSKCISSSETWKPYAEVENTVNVWVSNADSIFDQLMYRPVDFP